MRDNYKTYLKTKNNDKTNLNKLLQITKGRTTISTTCNIESICPLTSYKQSRIKTPNSTKHSHKPIPKTNTSSKPSPPTTNPPTAPTSNSSISGHKILDSKIYYHKRPTNYKPPPNNCKPINSPQTIPNKHLSKPKRIYNG